MVKEKSTGQLEVVAKTPDGKGLQLSFTPGVCDDMRAPFGTPTEPSR